MVQLYNVSFTTRTLVQKFDEKGKPVAQTQLNSPITMTMLPYATAMAYSGCDGFKMEPYVFQNQSGRKSSGKTTGVGNGTKKVNYERVEKGVSKRELKPAVASKGTGRSKIAEAAATGNLGAALNV